MYLGDKHIWSTIEVQQGDPLGPLLFVFVLYPPVHRIRDNYKRLCNTQSFEGQERKENPKFRGRLGESKGGLGEFERDPGRGVSDRLGE